MPKRNNGNGEGLNKQDQKKYLLSIFILAFPSLMIALFSSISNIMLRIVLQVLMLLFQLVLIKNYVDDYYGLE